MLECGGTYNGNSGFRIFFEFSDNIVRCKKIKTYNDTIHIPTFQGKGLKVNI
jgi:hypothetical protein